VQANSRLEASDAVRKQGYWLLELYAEPEPTTPIRAAQQSVWQPLFGGVPLKTLAVFFRQFATMLAAGVPMYQALETLGNHSPSVAVSTLSSTPCTVRMPCCRANPWKLVPSYSIRRRRLRMRYSTSSSSAVSTASPRRLPMRTMRV